MSVQERIYPGKRIILERTFTRAPGESFNVNPSSCTITLRRPNGAGNVAIDAGDVETTFPSATEMKVVARYTIPRVRASSGVWGVGWSVTGNLVTSYDETFVVETSLVL